MSFELVKGKSRQGPRKIGYVHTSEKCEGWESCFVMPDGKKIDDLDIVFWDKTDSKETAEPVKTQYLKMLKALRKGDTLVVPDLYSLETSIFELLDTIYSIQARGIYLQVLPDYIDTKADINHCALRLCDALLGFLEE